MIERMFMWCVIILTLIGLVVLVSMITMSFVLWIKTEFIPEWNSKNKKSD